MLTRSNELKRKVLIVEDENLIAMDLGEQLRELGYEVSGISDTAEKAILLAASQRPDLILMDIRLRDGGDGIEAAQTVRAEMDIPVVFVTAHYDDETLGRAKLAEPFGYIVKPFCSANIRAAIEVALHKHATESYVRGSLKWLNGEIVKRMQPRNRRDREG